MKRPFQLLSAAAIIFALGYTLFRYSEIQLRVEEDGFASIREMKILYKLGNETKADYELEAHVRAQVKQAEKNVFGKMKNKYESKSSTSPKLYTF